MRIGILSAHRLNDQPADDNLHIGEEVRELGHEPVYINYRRGVIGLSKAANGLYQFDRDETSLWPVEVDAVIPRIGKKAYDGILALSTMELAGIPSTAPSDGLRIAKSKIETKLRLNAANIPLPESIVPLGLRPKNDDMYMDLLAPDIQGPVIIKHNYGSLGKGVMLAESSRSARSFIDTMHDSSFIIEEFIEPIEDTKPFDVRTIVIDSQHVVSMLRSATTTKKKQEFRANLSLDGTGELYEPKEEELEIVMRTARAMGLPTVGVDTMHTKDGRVVVTEGNGNFGLTVERVTGVTVARRLAEYAVRLAHGTVVQVA